MESTNKSAAHKRKNAMYKCKIECEAMQTTATKNVRNENKQIKWLVVICKHALLLAKRLDEGWKYLLTRRNKKCQKEEYELKVNKFRFAYLIINLCILTIEMVMNEKPISSTVAGISFEWKPAFAFISWLGQIGFRTASGKCVALRTLQTV